MDENGGLKENGNREDVAAELQRIFDAEQELLPPLFFETVMLGEGLEQEVDGLEEKDWRERALRRFFQEAGLDYAHYRRRQRQARLRKGLLAVALLLALLGALVLTQPRVLQAIRRPLLRFSGVKPTPALPEGVVYYYDVAEVQPYFSLALPQEPPTGFALEKISLQRGDTAGPRVGFTYRRTGQLDFSDRVEYLYLSIWLLSDEAFPFPVGITPEEVEIGGRTALWIKGTGGGRNVQVWRPEGGWVIWEEAPYKLALASRTMSRGELLELAAGIIGR